MAAASAAVGGHQFCPITAIEIELGQEQTQQSKRDYVFLVVTQVQD